MRSLRSYAGSALLGAVLALLPTASGCMTDVRAATVPYEYAHVRPTLDDDSDVVRYFRGTEHPHLGTDRTRPLERRVHDLLEGTFDRAFGEDISFAHVHYESPGSTVYLSRRGELGIIASRILYTGDVTDDERDALTIFAEYEGPQGMADLDTGSEEVRMLAQALHGMRSADDPILSFSWRSTAREVIRARYGDREPQYAAYGRGMSGYSLNLLLGHYVRLDPDQDSLAEWVGTLSHEMTHTLIFPHSSVSYDAQFLAGYIHWSRNQEIVTIHESACNIAGDVMMRRFFQEHVDPRSQAYREFREIDSEQREHDALLRAMIGEYERMPREERIARRDEIFGSFSRRMEEHGFGRPHINEAYLSLRKRYGGSRDTNGELELLLSRLGFENFVRLIPYLFTYDDLHVAYARAKEQEHPTLGSVIEPIRHRHDLMDLDAIDDMQF